MSAKKKILLLATGGTIASKKSENGLKPQITPEELLEYIPQVKEFCEVSAIQLLNLDSSNMEPEHWKKLYMQSGNIMTLMMDLSLHMARIQWHIQLLHFLI